MTTYQEENDALIESFLGHTFYRGMKNPQWKAAENLRGIEFIINATCNLACKYCYFSRFGDKLYPDSINNKEDILKNTDIMIDWIVDNGYDPKIEIFSGDPLVQPIGREVIRKLIDGLAGKINGPVVCPTNFTFILHDSMTKEVEDILVKSREMKLPMHLSASFDGKYCESNRPFLGTHDMVEQSNRIIRWEDKGIKEPRDDEYYDKVFIFAKKWGAGFHPMVYSEKIEDWEKNFLWFQENFKKHDIPWTNIYLLEVRNPEWSEQQILDFQRFIKFLIKWAWNMVGKNFNNYMDFLFKHKGFNLLSSALTTIGRGIGCSLQSCLYIRLGDLSIVPCHRQGYEHMILGKFKVEDDKVVGVQAINPELWIAEISFNAKALPYCQTCILKYMCSMGCLGCQYENTGDPFTPIPSMCQMEYAKIEAMVETYKELGILQSIKNQVRPEKIQVIEYMEEMLEVKNE